MPTLSRKCRRSATSRRTRCAIARSVSVSSSGSTHSSAARAESAVNSSMLSPPTVTARDSGRSRAPSQAGHGCIAISSSTRSRVFSESVFS